MSIDILHALFVIFFVWLYIEMPETVTVNCIKCTKGLKFSRNSLKCQVCQKQIHLKCSWLSRQGFLEYKRGGTSFTCQFCLDYCCLQYNKHVYYGQKGILCSRCDKWSHQKCVGLSSLEYKMLSQDGSNEPWFCQCCKKDMYCFYDLTNTNFLVSWNQTAPVLFQTILISPNLYCTALFAKK